MMYFSSSPVRRSSGGRGSTGGWAAPLPWNSLVFSLLSFRTADSLSGESCCVARSGGATLAGPGWSPNVASGEAATLIGRGGAGSGRDGVEAEASAAWSAAWMTSATVCMFWSIPA